MALKSVLICLTIGIPGAGKSTLCKLLKDHLVSWTSTAVVTFCYDELVPPDSDLQAFSMKERKDEIVKKVEQFIVAFRENELSAATVDCLSETELNHLSQAEKLIILIDDNMYLRSMRYKYFQVAKRNSCSFVQIMICINLAQAQERNASRSNPVPEESLQKIWRDLQTPNVAFAWEKNSFFIESRYENEMETLLTDICHFFRVGMESTYHPLPVNDPSESRSLTHNSVLHNVDLTFRRCIKDSIATNPSLTFFAKQMSTDKSACLSYLRRGAWPKSFQSHHADSISIVEEILERIDKSVWSPCQRVDLINAFLYFIDDWREH